MLVCICNNVNTDKFENNTKKLKCFNSVCKKTKACSKCGKCKSYAQTLFNDILEKIEEKNIKKC